MFRAEDTGKKIDSQWCNVKSAIHLRKRTPSVYPIFDVIMALQPSPCDIASFF